MGKATEDMTILIGKVRKTFCIGRGLKILNCSDKFVYKFSAELSYLSLLPFLR